MAQHGCKFPYQKMTCNVPKLVFLQAKQTDRKRISKLIYSFMKFLGG